MNIVNNQEHKSSLLELSTIQHTVFIAEANSPTSEYKSDISETLLLEYQKKIAVQYAWSNAKTFIILHKLSYSRELLNIARVQ